MLKIENLRKLADFLRALPEDYDNFVMVTFFEGSLTDYLATKNVCGTPACALGHGLAAGIDTKQSIFDFNWFNYCNELAGVSFWSNQAQFMFGTGWPDCPRLAADRIEFLINNPDITLTIDHFVAQNNNDDANFWSMLDELAFA